MISSAIKHVLRVCRIAISSSKRMDIPTSSAIESAVSGSKRKLNEDDEVLEKKYKCNVDDDEEKVTALPSDKIIEQERKFERKKPKQKKPISMHQINSLAKHNADVFDENETSYYFENGFRKVHPYYFTFHTFCKERWLGKSLLEIYSKEFRYYPVSHYEKARKAGKLLLNMKPIPSLEVTLKSNDMLTSRLHRHEGSVIGSEIKILVDDSKYLVVDKPSSIPIHPCGRYRMNSLIYILKKELKYENLLGCYRLDRLTSGIVIFAKTKNVARKVVTEIRERQVEKEYICEVVGQFPATEKPVVCHQPVTVVDRKLGLCAAWEVDGFKSKDACTEFERISYNGVTSIVRCRPKTGRTHQIRVHLQYLGYPIVNDPMYNHVAWGEDRFLEGQCSKPVQDVAMKISRTYDYEPYNRPHNDGPETLIPEDGPETLIPEDGHVHSSETLTVGDSKPVITNDVPDEGSEPSRTNAAAAVDSDRNNDPHYSPDCAECHNPLPDPNMEWMVMHLHALRYKGSDWGFETPLPEWAQQDKSVENSPATGQ